MDELNKLFKRCFGGQKLQEPTQPGNNPWLHSFRVHLLGMQSTQGPRAECTLDTCCTSKINMVDAQGT